MTPNRETEIGALYKLIHSYNVKIVELEKECNNARQQREIWLSILNHIETKDK